MTFVAHCTVHVLSKVLIVAFSTPMFLTFFNPITVGRFNEAQTLRLGLAYLN